MIINHSTRISGPRNDRAVAVARTRIDQLTPLAQRELHNALTVNGIPSLIYQKLVSGRTCSCSKRTTDDPAQVFDEDGNASPQHIASLLTGNRFSINDYARHPTRGTDLGTEPDLIDGSVPQVGAETVSSVAQDPLAAVYDVTGDADFDMHPDQYDNGACPCCFGTGIVGGYTLLGGARIVVDASYPGAVASGATLDQLQPLHVLNWLHDGALEWEVSIPLYSTVALRAFNGGTEVALRLQKWGTTWTDVNAADLSTGQTMRLRLVAPATTALTHVELQVVQAHTLIEFPHLNRTADVSILDTTQDVQLVVSPLAPKLSPGDLVADTCWGHLWRIRDVTDNSDNQHQHMGWDCNARIVQPYEQLSILTRGKAHAPTPPIFNQRETPGFIF